MEFPKPPPLPSNPLLSLSTFIHRIGTELATRLHHTNHLAASFALNFSPPAAFRHRPLFASISQPKAAAAAAATLSPEQVAKSLSGTAVYTVSNTNNEFVLISDPNGAKSIGLLCFRQEDAESFLAQVSYIFNFMAKFKAFCVDFVALFYRFDCGEGNWEVMLK